MRLKFLFRIGRTAIINASFILMLLLSAMTLKAQTPVNFSGNWEFDKNKSKLTRMDVSYDGTIIREIIQTSDTIAYADLYIKPGNEDWKTAFEKYNLNGKELIQKDFRGTNKSSAKWSKDGKSLTVSNLAIEIADSVTKEFLIADTYKLSEDGLTLTIESYSKNPVLGENNSFKLYHKKVKK